MELMLAFAMPFHRERDLIDSLRSSTAKLGDIWETRNACVSSLKATGNLINTRYG